MNSSYDVIIVGGGILGAWAAYKLSQTPFKVLLVEASTIAGGISGHPGAGVRAYHGDDRLVHLTLRALEDYRRLHLSYPHLSRRIGSLYFVDEKDLSSVNTKIQAMRSQDWHSEVLNAEQGSRSFSQFCWNKSDYAVYEPDAICFDAQAATALLIDLAEKNGATIQVRASVAAILTKNEAARGIQLETGKRIEAGHVVLAAGLGTKPLLDPFGPFASLRYRSIQVGVFQMPANLNFPLFFDSRLQFYGRGVAGNFYLGHALSDWQSSADASNPFSPQDTDISLRLAASKIPALREFKFVGGIRSFDVYGQKLSDITLHPHISGLYSMTGFGGAGFKIAPALAKQITTMITGEVFHEEL